MTRTFLSVEVTPDLKRILKERAEIEGGTVSALVTRVLVNAAKRWPTTPAKADGPS